MRTFGYHSPFKEALKSKPCADWVRIVRRHRELRQARSLHSHSPAAAIDRAPGHPLCPASVREQAVVSWPAPAREDRCQASGTAGTDPLRCCAFLCFPAVRFAGGRAIPGREHRNVDPNCQRRGCTNRAAGGVPATPVPPPPSPPRDGLASGSPHRRPRCLPLGKRAPCLLWRARPQRCSFPPRPPSGSRCAAAARAGAGVGEGHSGRGVGSVSDRRPRGGPTSSSHT